MTLVRATMAWGIRGEEKGNIYGPGSRRKDTPNVDVAHV
jgi:hypothetical protein